MEGGRPLTTSPTIDLAGGRLVKRRDDFGCRSPAVFRVRVLTFSLSLGDNQSIRPVDRSASGVSRLGARSINLSLCSLRPVFRYLSTVVRSTKPANSTVIPLCVSDHERRHHHRGSRLRQFPRLRGTRRPQVHRLVSLQSLAIRPSSRARTESRVLPIPVRGRCHLNNSGRLRNGFRAPSCARPR